MKNLGDAFDIPSGRPLYTADEAFGAINKFFAADPEFYRLHCEQHRALFEGTNFCSGDLRARVFAYRLARDHLEATTLQRVQ